MHPRERWSPAVVCGVVHSRWPSTLIRRLSGLSWERGRPSSKVERRNGTRSRIAVPERLGRARAHACGGHACATACSALHAYKTLRDVRAPTDATSDDSSLIGGFVYRSLCVAFDKSQACLVFVCSIDARTLICSNLCALLRYSIFRGKWLDSLIVNFERR